MRLFSWWIVSLAVVVLVTGCTTVDPSECWPNTSGGLGGGGPIPIGAGVGATSGDFLSPPPKGPLDYGGTPNPCIEPQSSCNEKCLADYEAAAIECGKIGDATQRKTCQDDAYASYKTCKDSCQQSNSCRKDCEDQADACEAKCSKLPKDDKAGRQKCWVACNDAFAVCVKKCKD
jgi:hypothetical protein